MSGLAALDYGQLLIAQKVAEGVSLSYDELRDRSASVIAPSNVRNLDEEVIAKISQMRVDSDVILDSHAVTRETYGFRAVPFSLDQLRRLALDGVMVLRCDAEVLLTRMDKDRQGRRQVTAELAREHQLLQEGIGVSYAIACGCPIYVLDTTELTQDEVLANASEILVGMGASTDASGRDPISKAL
jgi:adenylate kinase